MAKYAGNPGISFYSIFDGDLSSAIGAGEEFALYLPNPGVPSITWQTIFSSAPASVSVRLEGSLDGVSWGTIDTSTNVNGEIRQIIGPYNFVRANNNAVTGGAGLELSVLILYNSAGSIDTGGGSVDWGDIGGTLSNQTDLQTELDNKLDDSELLREQTTSDATNATTTMANITALSITLAAIKYSFELVLFVNESVAAEGFKIDFDGGAAIMTNFRVHGLFYDTALLKSVQTSALATDMDQASFIGDGVIIVKGSMEVSGAGTFIPRFAQSSHTSGTATVYRGSYLTMMSME